MPSYEVFEKLPNEKKDKILKACMEVFAEKGYEGASTNDIVKRAGISKGILFHYFGNKKNLYLYILNKALDRVIDRFYSPDKALPADMFERIAESGMLKLKIALEEPLLYKLIYFTFINTPEALREDVQEIYKRLYSIAIPMLTEGLDLSKLRSGVDPQKALEIVLFFLEGLQARYIEIFKNMQPEESLKLMDKLMEDSKIYMDVLKKGIYKNQ